MQVNPLLGPQNALGETLITSLLGASLFVGLDDEDEVSATGAGETAMTEVDITGAGWFKGVRTIAHPPVAAVAGPIDCLSEHRPRSEKVMASQVWLAAHASAHWLKDSVLNCWLARSPPI